MSLGPVPDRYFEMDKPMGKKMVYSWAYHRTEVLGKNEGLEASGLKEACRVKAREVLAIAGL